ncbi:putative hemolysin [Pantoea sp. FN0307]|uniref:putative hemolysin n=1 Tax=Pantoea sp. FN0307 TaxID=3418560 RepID=UPI003CF8414E
MKAATFLLAGAALLLSACSSSDNEPPQQATAAHVQPRVSMSSLAESNCALAGGTLAFSRQLDGSSTGMCQLANGRRCSERALESGSCARF